MEARLGGNGHHFYGPVVSDLKALGKKSLEWDLNDWKWDGDLFTASPLNSVPSDCRSRQLFPLGSEIPTSTKVSNSFSYGSEEMAPGNDKGKRELEKKRRVVDVEVEEFTDEVGSLNLKLGGQVYPVAEAGAENWDRKNGKKKKVGGPSSNRAVCQVEDCQADLSNAKDYHRRHKVCDGHSKATRALVGNVMQRFCQQCSRFHVLQEFDEGKRSCRRRLAGHNRRRRKTHPENMVSSTPPNDDRDNNYLLITLLRILANIHSNNNSDQVKDQDLLSNLLRSLGNLSGVVNERSLTGLSPASQDLQNAGTSDVTLVKDHPKRSMLQRANVTALESARGRLIGDDNRIILLENSTPSQSALVCATEARKDTFGSVVGKTKLGSIDLNSAYDDSQDCLENLQNYDAPKDLGKAPTPGCPLWIQKDPFKSSPAQTSGNSGSTSSQSPSSSSSEGQNRTDRIVLKLFGKDPSDFPLALRKQILDWLSNSPTDIESYIRPGCVILTIYLQMDESKWEELCYDLCSSLKKLLDASTDSFWRSGWIYARVSHHLAFVSDGDIVLDTHLPHRSLRTCQILNIRPIAVCSSDRVDFLVKGYNICRPTTRLLCALEGTYLVNECHGDVVGGSESFTEQAQIQTLNFSCTVPNVNGRGFIEVEDHGLSNSFFPFIVAERDVCSEICSLEAIIEATESAGNAQGGLEHRRQALYFIHEMGWLLHRCQSKSRLGQNDPICDLFPYRRFRWLVDFSVEHDWCAVVKKLLNIILFCEIIDASQFSSIEDALLDIGLLHRAVRRNSRPMVEILLRFRIDGISSKAKLSSEKWLFRPDLKGPGGLTPLHIAAGCDGSEHVLDALTDDPGLVGVGAWKTACDSTGLTPYDYACLRGHYSYIHLVQKKTNKRSISDHVSVEIVDKNSKEKQQQVDGEKTGRVVGVFQMEKGYQQQQCKLCEQKFTYGKSRTSLAIYRPAMVSMVAIAAVCVCVALLFKSSPKVLYVFGPFRWELLEYGSS